MGQEKLLPPSSVKKSLELDVILNLIFQPICFVCLRLVSKDIDSKWL
jgi:hypothetical protein